jgi:hypothetical protein
MSLHIDLVYLYSLLFSGDQEFLVKLQELKEALEHDDYTLNLKGPRREVNPIVFILTKAQNSPSKNEREQYPFAIRDERAAQIIRLLHRFCVEASPPERLSPLGMTLLFPQSLHCMRALLECGETFNEYDRRRSPLLYISRQGDSHYDMLKLLAAYNERQLSLHAAREVDPISGNTVLHESVKKLFFDYSYPFKIPEMIAIFIRYFGANPYARCHSELLPTAIDMFYSLSRRERTRSGEEYNHFMPGQTIPFAVWWDTVLKTEEILQLHPKFIAAALPIVKPYQPLMSEEERRGHISCLAPENSSMILRLLDRMHVGGQDEEIADLLRNTSI